MSNTTEMHGALGATPIGSPLVRIDGPLKVSGKATYTADRHLPGMLTAVPLCATIAKGRITRLDDVAARAMPGVRAVFTAATIGKLYNMPAGGPNKTDETVPPLQDQVIRYYGQYVALVVADTFEQASAAAAAINVSYVSAAPNVSMQLATDEKLDLDSDRGDTAGAFAGSAVQVDQVYRTPVETHNPIELHATLATWDGTGFVLYETSQAVVNHKVVMCRMLGVAPENMRIVSEYLGGGFGGKLWPWGHSLLAASAARHLGRPVKLVLSRAMMFHNVGHRTNTQQRVRLGATADGRLLSLQQDYLYHTAQLDASKEHCGEVTEYLYGAPNLRVTGGAVKRDIGPNTSMRGPGAAPGLFATESALDELALKLGMDPVALRLLNEPALDASLGVPFSSRHLAECLRTGADKFGWSRRSAAVGAMRDGDAILGWGMASGGWRAKRIPASAAVALRADGTVRVTCATQDIGTGTYTILAQMVAAVAGVAVARVDVGLGDTAYPPGPMSGGSQATASLVPAVVGATRAAIAEAQRVATLTRGGRFEGADPATLVYADGTLRRAGELPSSGLGFADVLQAAGLSHVDGSAHAGDSGQDPGAAKISIHSYAAHFVEVAWQPEIARLRVRRVVSVIDGGKIINPRTGRNQIEGAIIMSVGMALFEATRYDERNGAPINASLADYVLTTHADAPAMDVTFLDYPDTALNEIGARGIGEIGMAGLAPAITAAVYHATGKRVRSLPVSIEDLLD